MAKARAEARIKVAHPVATTMEKDTSESNWLIGE